MSNNFNLTEILKQSLRVALGSASALAENLQDPLKLSQNLDEIQTKFLQIAQELAQKGEVTEQTLCNKAEELINQYQPSTEGNKNSNNITTIQITDGDSEEGEEKLENLTQTIIDLRKELENLT